MTWKVDQFWWKFFGTFNRLLLRLKIFFYFFEVHVDVLNQFEKKNENLKKISKNLQFLKFHLWVCGRNFGRSAENSVKNILLPKILTKKILSKIRPLKSVKMSKKSTPPKKKNGHLRLGGGSHFICQFFPSKVLNCQNWFFGLFKPLKIERYFETSSIVEISPNCFLSL